MKKIFVTRPYFPPIEDYKSYIDQIWDAQQLTNHGPLHNTLEKEIKSFLGVENFHFVTNGTLALQIALRALDVTSGEVITTPFSYVATVSSILWERCTPVFVDIDPKTFCIDVDKIEAAITENTKAIMGVHVFGYPCAVEEIDVLAKKYNLKVIYDGAHTFGCKYNGKSLLDYGDIAICSFHATKVFHTIEGGGIISRGAEMNRKIGLLRSFGHIGDEHFELGINAKSSEMQAAMGLCNLKKLKHIVDNRRKICELYDQVLPLEKIQRPEMPKNLEYNFGYYPVAFRDEAACLKVMEILNLNNIFPRRYFYPSLNTLPYVEQVECPVSDTLSKRILCLPLYHDLEEETVRQIASIITEALGEA